MSSLTLRVSVKCAILTRERYSRTTGSDMDRTGVRLAVDTIGSA